MSGMNSPAVRIGEANDSIVFTTGRTSLGAVLLAHSADGVCAILLGDDPQRLAHDLRAHFVGARLVEDDCGLQQALAVVVEAIERPGPSFELPLDIRGTEFQRKVWRILREIPPGAPTSYAEVARRIGAPKALRAVAGACAANVLALAIPCHRVVRSNGSLSGYRWGMERKRILLQREAEWKAATTGSACSAAILR
jgi:AraC family transcriptional regulator of adaptative response/methylated-DNA-[protein]-cysteine methyltransferase